MSRRMGDRLGVSETETVRRRADGPVSTTVVQAVADARGTAELALPPLGDIVDPDTLDALCAERCGSSRVAFDYAGHRVQVAGDGTVTVTTTDAGPQGPVWPSDEQR